MFPKSLIVLFSLLLLATAPVLAQSRVKVIGVVKAADSKTPLAGAVVTEIRSKRGTVTDAYGRFSIELAIGDTLQVRAMGYKPRIHPLHLPPVDQMHTEVLLELDNVLLKEVQINPDAPVRTITKPEPGLPPGLTPASPIFSPWTFLYNKYSKEGKQRRKLQKLQMQEWEEYQRNQRLKQNQFYKDNTGYEN